MPTKKTSDQKTTASTKKTKATAAKKTTAVKKTKTTATAKKTKSTATAKKKPATATKKPATATKKSPPQKAEKKQPKLDLPDNAKDLSEELLLEMPDSMYMNELQLDFFRLKLEAMRAEILQEISDAKERLKTPPEVGDEVDMAGLVESQQIDIRIVERKTKLLVNVESAIKRIKDDEYGYCTETGEPIGIARLLVRPTATLCITSKEVHEAKEKQEEL